MRAPREPSTWLAVSNALWLAGGMVAYATRASLVLLTAVALVPSLPALLEMRRVAPGAWLDRALAAATGAWAAMAILVVTPYMATEGGVSLWTSRGFAGLGIALASLGMLLWNAAACHVVGCDRRRIRAYAGLHVALIVVAVYLVATGDGGRHDVVLRGQTYGIVDLEAAPLVASLAALPWAAAFLRVRAAGPTAA